MAENREDKLEEEMAQRLDDLFIEGDDDSGNMEAPMASPVMEEPGADPALNEIRDMAGESPSLDPLDPLMEQGGSVTDDNHALRELKATILSMDWEITDEVMDRLIEQVRQVKSEHGQDRNMFLLLKLISAVSKYIRVNKGRAHPNAINLIKSNYSGIERLILEPELSAGERKKVLIAEIRKFKDLKAQIGQAQAGSAPTAVPAAAVGPGEANELSKGKLKELRVIVADVVKQELSTFKRELLAEINRR